MYSYSSNLDLFKFKLKISPVKILDELLSFKEVDSNFKSLCGTICVLDKKDTHLKHNIQLDENHNKYKISDLLKQYNDGTYMFLNCRDIKLEKTDTTPIKEILKIARILSTPEEIREFLPSIDPEYETGDYCCQSDCMNFKKSTHKRCLYCYRRLCPKHVKINNDYLRTGVITESLEEIHFLTCTCSYSEDDTKGFIVRPNPNGLDKMELIYNIKKIIGFNFFDSLIRVRLFDFTDINEMYEIIESFEQINYNLYFFVYELMIAYDGYYRLLKYIEYYKEESTNLFSILEELIIKIFSIGYEHLKEIEDLKESLEKQLDPSDRTTKNIEIYENIERIRLTCKDELWQLVIDFRENERLVQTFIDKNFEIPSFRYPKYQDIISIGLDLS